LAGPASSAQLQELQQLLSQLERVSPERDWKAECRETAGVPRDQMTDAIAADLIRHLRTELGAVRTK
jgi:hypothetical protein